MGAILNIKPKNLEIIENKPKNSVVNRNDVDYLENKQIRVGEPMGLLLSITYPININFIAKRP
jgi:hypothetical protein